MKTENILAALREHGGLVIAQRQQGKTTALLSFAAAHPGEYVILASSERSADNLRQLADKEITADPSFARGTAKRVLIDEFFSLRQIPERFHAAVGTPPFPITIV